MRPAAEALRAEGGDGFATGAGAEDSGGGAAFDDFLRGGNLVSVAALNPLVVDAEVGLHEPFWAENVVAETRVIGHRLGSGLVSLRVVLLMLAIVDQGAGHGDRRRSIIPGILRFFLCRRSSFRQITSRYKIRGIGQNVDLRYQHASQSGLRK